MHNNSHIRNFLIQLLAAKSPELGARLKQRLSALCVNSGLGRFNEREFGYLKFSEYLSRVHGDIVSILHRDQGGDILVSLLVSPDGLVTENVSQPQASRQPRVRNDVWQAFSNPDPKRHRFLNRKTGEVRHYLEHEQNRAKAEVEAAPDAFSEITPIDAETQHRWMHEYLDTIQLPAKKRDALSALLDTPYSSQLNAAFSRALDDQASAWRRFRVDRVIAYMELWAEEHKISRNLLFADDEVVTAKPGVAVHTSVPMNPRQQAAKLLELLSDDDIARLIIPTLLSSIAVRARA